jgi:Holliday junction resolvasome RuvABC endonuclease subunit
MTLRQIGATRAQVMVNRLRRLVKQMETLLESLPPEAQDVRNLIADAKGKAVLALGAARDGYK